MSRFEEFLELENQVKELKENNLDYTKRIEKMDKKNRDLENQLLEEQQKNMEFNTKILKYEGKIILMENERENFEQTKASLQKQNSELFQRIDEFDYQFKKFREMIEDSSNKLESYYAERDQLQNEKFELNKKLNSEILDLTNKLNDANKKYDDVNVKFSKMKERYQKAADSVMGVSTELDKLKSEKAVLEDKLTKLTDELETLRQKAGAQPAVEVAVSDDSELKKENDSLKSKILELNAQLSAEKDRIEGMKNDYNKKLAEMDKALETSTDDEEIKEQINAIVSSLSQFNMLIKLAIPEATRSLRVVVPKYEDLAKNGIMEVLDQLPHTIIKNIGCGFPNAGDKPAAKDLEKNGYKFTDLGESNLYCFTIDDTKAGLMVIEKDGSVSGFFTKHPLLIPIVNQSVLSIIVKGDKLE